MCLVVLIYRRGILVGCGMGLLFKVIILNVCFGKVKLWIFVVLLLSMWNRMCLLVFIWMGLL